MLTVKELMTANPITVTSSTPLRQAQGIMEEQGIRQLPVVDNKALVGIITDRDVRSVANLPINDTLTTGSIMTPSPVTVSSYAPIHKAAELLNVYKFGSLPVVDAGQLVGIVTVSDFLNYFISNNSTTLA